MKKTPNANELSADSQAFVDAITKDFSIVDRGGLETLHQAALCLDRIAEARAILSNEGLTILDRFKQRRPHPANQIERDARNGFLASMRLLGLDGSAELNGGGCNA